MKNKTIRLTESAIMLALGTILSVLPILNLPYGGSITLCSTLPLLVIAYRYGTAWGLFTGAAFGILQMFLGMNNVMYFTTPLSIAAVILLDYVLAFTVLGLGGTFRKRCKNQTTALLAGTLLYSVIRYVLHVISGCTVWAGLSIPDNAAFVYSLAYNATYMLPETIVTMLGVALISGVLDFNRDTVSRSAKTGIGWHKPIAGLIAAGALIYAVVEVFSHLQDPETGDFIITGLQNAAWMPIGIVSAVAALLIGVLLILHNRKNK